MIDFRSPEEFALGHVDGATNVPMSHLIDPQTWLFKAIELRRQAVEAAGVDLTKEVTVMD